MVNIILYSGLNNSVAYSLKRKIDLLLSAESNICFI